MKETTESNLKLAEEFHQKQLVVDLHSDVHLDVIRSRGRGEKRVLARRHLPLWKKRVIP